MFKFFNTPARRVQRGVKLLEAYDPEWYNKINLTTFDIRSGYRCAAAQVTGTGYGNALVRLGLDRWDDGGRYGFYGIGDDQNNLNDEWRHVVTLKQQQHLESLLTDNNVTV